MRLFFSEKDAGEIMDKELELIGSFLSRHVQ